ncbi:MAG: PQQ-dependent sugar dehydrogenase, partial [Wenzhouxiangellaceae bacterium]
MRALNLDDAVVETAVSGLDEPWAFEFIGDNQVLITETRGRMLRVPLDGRPPKPIDGLPEIATEREQTGLLDVELHPGFHVNRRIYFSYVAPDETGRYYATAVDTAILEDDRLSRRRTLLRVEPFAWSPSNFGGVMEFDPEGYLYVSVGDRSEPATAQMGDRLQGKILRLNDDGSVPADNPFVHDPAIDDRIWALGVRNPQGLHYDGPSGFIFEAEHGPMGGDEINIIRRGANYGWPTISYGRNYTAEALGFAPDQHSPQLDFHLSTDPGFEIGARTERIGMEQPLFYYLPSTAISPLTVVRGPMFPEWEGHILVGALKGRHVSKIDYDGRDVRSEVRILTEFRGRIRDLNVAEDGSIWILVQSGELYRLFRDPDLLPLQRAVARAEDFALAAER